MSNDDYISEGEALSDWLEGVMDLEEKYDDEEDYEEKKSPLLSNLKPNAVDVYTKNKASKVGEIIRCPTCGKPFEKKSYQQAFCRKRGVGGKLGKGNLCKDTYHNSTNETRRLRASFFK